MSLTLFIFTFFSMALILIPFTFAIIYWVKKGLFFDQKTNIIVIYFIVTIFLHIWVTYLAFNRTNNLFLIRANNFVDISFVGLFLLSLYLSSTQARIIITILLLSVIYLIDQFLGVPETSPNEQISAVSIILILLVILTTKKINYTEEKEKAYSYFLIAIVIGAINNLSNNFSDIHPNLFVIIINIGNIASYTFYSLGFYTLIRTPQSQNNL